MQNDKEKIERGGVSGRRWQFWFLVSFSLLLVVTFVLYLPARFERNFLREELGHGAVSPGHDPEVLHGHGETRYHEEGEVTEGLVVNFSMVSANLPAGELLALEFFVNAKPESVPVSSAELQLNHEKLMHVIGVRSDLNEFFHIHPEPVAEKGLFGTGYTFEKPGLYKVWSEVKKDDVVHAFGHPVFNVEGEGAREEKQVSFGRNVIVADYQVALELEELVESEHEHDLFFSIHTLTSDEVELEDYLGAPMHLAVIKDDLTEFIHAHPEEGGHTHGYEPELLWPIPAAMANGGPTHASQEEHDASLGFHVAFPEAGLYKLFAQFRPKGSGLGEDEALVASFWVQVVESSGITGPEDHHESAQVRPLVSGAWWLLLAVSLVFIGLLSFGVHRFVTVKK